MGSSAQKALGFALIALCAAGCADDDAGGDDADAGHEVATFDASVAASDADADTPVSDAASSADATRPARNDPQADAGRMQRPDAGPSRGPDDAGRMLDAAAQDSSARDAAVRDAAMHADAAPASDAGPGSCPAHGSVRYTLAEKSAASSDEQMAYTKIRAAMDKAVEKYNCYTNLSREVRASYEPGVATADGSTNGSIRFGSDASMHFVTAMHELGHVFGVGSNEFKPLVKDGVFTGAAATAELRRISDDAKANVMSDGTHFWPYGLNYVSEYKSEADLIGHCAIVMAIRKDLGL